MRAPRGLCIASNFSTVGSIAGYTFGYKEFTKTYCITVLQNALIAQTKCSVRWTLKKPFSQTTSTLVQIIVQIN